MLITRFNQYDQAINARLLVGPVNVAPGKLVPDCLFLNSPQPAEMLIADGNPAYGESGYTVFE